MKNTPAPYPGFSGRGALQKKNR